MAEQRKQGGAATDTSGEKELTNGIDEAKDSAVSLVDQAKSGASDALGAAKQKAGSMLDERKTQLKDGLTEVAETVRKASGSLGDGGNAESKINEYAVRYTEKAADKIEGIARYFDENDLRVIVRDVESYARRNPAVFIGGAFALGLVAARFIKSTNPIEPATQGRSLKALSKQQPKQPKEADYGATTAAANG